MTKKNDGNNKDNDEEKKQENTYPPPLPLYCEPNKSNEGEERIMRQRTQ